MRRARASRPHAGRRLLSAVPLLVALCLAASAIVPLTIASAKPARHAAGRAHKHKTVRKHRTAKKTAVKKATKKAAVKPPTSMPAGTPACTPTPATPGAVDAATQAFLAHLYAAHLQ